MTTSLKYIPTLNLETFVAKLTAEQNNRMESPFDQHKDFFIGQLSKVQYNEFLDSPYIYDFFTVYLVKSGSLTKINLLKSLSLEADEIFFSKPGEIKTWMRVDTLEGYIVAFTLDYLLLLLDNKNLINTFEYMLPESQRKFRLDTKQMGNYTNIMQELMEEYQERDEHSDQLIKFHIYMMMIKTNRIYAKDYAPSKIPRSKKSSDFIYIRFMEVLEDCFQRLAQGQTDRPMRVTEFAEVLNINPTYLGECIRKASGRSAKSIINDRTLLLAKCQLLHTHNNISEIAYQLGFESSGYFIRFFKKFEKITPGAYRNLHF